MSFAVKRVGNFLKIRNKGMTGIYNLQNFNSITVDTDSTNDVLYVSYKGGYNYFDTLDDPVSAINEISYEIEGWKPAGVYDKKI